MKLLVLGRADAVHVIRWCNGLCERGHEVHLATMHSPNTFNPLDPRIRIHPLSRSLPGPLGYRQLARAFRDEIDRVQPDLIHAHYAGVYGTLARWADARPLVLSVYGHDVFQVPRISPFHRNWIIRNLRHATVIGSTSDVMRRRVLDDLLPGADVIVTPFGVDLEDFDPARFPAMFPARFPARPPGAPPVIGTARALKPKYGIDTLIRAVALLHREGRSTLKLEIVGSGPARDRYGRLARREKIDTHVTFHGEIAHHRIPELLSGFDVFAAPSRLDGESFGVAVIEASAMEKPVVVSRIGGLPEVVEEGVTGLICPKEDPPALARALARVLDDPDLAARLGAQGRRRVEAHYSWPACLDRMEALYERALSLSAPSAT